MKKHINSIIVFALVGAMLMAMVIGYSANVFADVKTTHWAREYIEQAFADGAVNGTYYNERTGERRFEPDKTLTVAEFAAVLTRSFFPSETKAAEAAKKSSDKWYDPFMKVGTEKNLFRLGFTKKTANVAPTQECSRYIMAVMIFNVMMDRIQYGYIYPIWEERMLAAEMIPDLNKIPDDYSECVLYVYAAGFLQGVDKNGTFAGDQTVTRAQMATIYCRMKKAFQGYGPEIRNMDPVDPTPDPVTPTPDPVVTTQKLMNGKEATVENVLEMLEELKETKYPHGTYYDPDTPYTINVGFPGEGRYRGTQCAKLAYMISDDIFGMAPIKEVKDFMDLRPGDIIRTTTHWCICISYPKQFPTTGGWYVDTADGNLDGYISWTGGSCFEEYYGWDGVAIYTRYIE